MHVRGVRKPHRLPTSPHRKPHGPGRGETGPRLAAEAKTCGPGGDDLAEVQSTWRLGFHWTERPLRFITRGMATIRSYNVTAFPALSGIREARILTLRDEPMPGLGTSSKLLLDTPQRVADLILHLAAEKEPTGDWQWEVETAYAFLVSSRRTLMAWQRLSTGTVDTLLLHPRELFRLAVVASAQAIIVAHTHPSGDASPSESDCRVTRELVRAGQLLRIEVLDHVIVGNPALRGERPAFSSLRELGYFSN